MDTAVYPRLPVLTGPAAVGARRLALAIVAALVLGGCAVGPQFVAPDAPQQATYAEPLPTQTVSAPVATGDAQRFLQDTPVPEMWWRNFASEELDRRIEQALANSPTIASAQAALRQAQENVAAARGSLFPSINASAGANRQNAVASGLATTASPFTVYNASVDVAYTLDLFGGVRRGVEVQSALADAQAYQLEGTYLSLAANVATTSFLEASLRAQIEATNEIVSIFEQQLDLTTRQAETGVRSQGEVLVAETQVASARAQLPALQQQLARTQTQLAVYLGRFPAEQELAALDLDALTLPQDIPLSLPSTLVRERPDIRAAEAQLHQATAQVGLATANLFPNITLSGSYGSQALDGSDLFGSGSTAWSLGLNLLQPIFRGGTLRAQKRAAEAGLDRASADYRNTVLTAFQNVADSLRALEYGAETLRAQADAERASAASLDIVRQQFRDGSVAFLQVLDSTRLYQQARLSVIQARAARLSDTAAFYAALGGGWRGDTESIAARSNP